MGRAVAPDDILDPKLLVRKGIAAAEAGDLALAIELLGLALTLNGDKAGGSLRLSRRARHPAHKVSRLRQMADRAATPDALSDAELLIREGIAATEAGYHARARNLLSLGLTLDDKHVRGWLWLSGEVTAPEDKEFCLRRVLTLDPDNEFAQQGMARLSVKVESPTDGKPGPRRAPDLVPEEEFARQMPAWPSGELAGLEDRESRLQRLVYRTATPDDLSDAELLIREGIAASEAGYHARARDQLSLGLTLDEESVQGWLWLSREVEDLADKEFCLRRVLTLDPGNDFARQGMASMQKQRRMDGLARQIQDLRQAVEVRAAPEPVLEARELELAGSDGGQATAGTLAESAVKARTRRRAQRVRTTRPLEEISERPSSWIGLVIRSEFALIAVLGLVLLVLTVRGVEGVPAPLPLLRSVLGLAFVLLVPGYAMQAALFPRGDALDGAERLALSFGLSVAVVPPMALILDWLPWGLSLWPIVAAEGLVTGLLSVVALIRRWRLPLEDRPLLAVNLDMKDWWATQDRTGRVLYGVLAGALLLALVSATAIILLPKPGEHFTEFYLLGPDGLAESYPSEAAPGQALRVTAGVANREGETAEYQVKVQVGGESIGAAGPVTLKDGEVWEAPVTYALPRVGDDQQVEFLLYRDGGQDPYRRLQLWINVVEMPGGSDG